MKYQLRQDLIGFGDDYTIKDEDGNAAYIIDGKVFTIGKSLDVKDAQGNKIGSIVKKKLALRPTYLIKKDGEVIAKIKKKITLFKDKLVIERENGEDYLIKGDLLEKDYEIRKGGRRVAEVSKKWFLTIRDTYGIEVEDEEDAFIVLCAAVVIDLIVGEEEED